MRFRPIAAQETVAARVILAVALVGIAFAAPTATVGVGPLPTCRLDDIRTVPHGYEDWQVTLVDWILTLGPSYEPPDLVSVQDGGVSGDGLVRQVAIEDLRAMAEAAESNGTPLVAWSPYRGYQEQKGLFRSYVAGYGFNKAITFSARPGHSEHQLGLTIDFVAVGDHGLSHKWEATPTGGWMAENAWQYGWLMSYPKGKKALTCYSYEPWHYRYVGRELAREIHDSGLTPREYLWANFTQVDVPAGEPSPSSSVAPPASEPPVSAGPLPTDTATELPAATPTPTGSNAGVVGFLTETPVLAGLLVALAALALLAIGLWRRPRRR